MGLTFTKTQWISVTHTYQSIHKITRLFHQQAHWAYHLTIPWKIKWNLHWGAQLWVIANLNMCEHSQINGMTRKCLFCIKCLRPDRKSIRLHFYTHTQLWDLDLKIKNINIISGKALENIVAWKEPGGKKHTRQANALDEVDKCLKKWSMLTIFWEKVVIK